MSYKRREFVRYLSKQGCVLDREGSNHSWWKNPAKDLYSSVPRHTKVDRHLARKMTRQHDLCGEASVPQSRAGGRMPVIF